MTESELIAQIAEDFGSAVRIQKYKAGHTMAAAFVDGQEYGPVSLYGPDSGYSDHTASYPPAFTLDGWAFAFHPDGWKIVRDGEFGHRRGGNPFPQLA